MEAIITVLIILVFTNFFSYKRGYNKCKSDHSEALDHYKKIKSRR